jgi:micrococcal nuclease
VLIRSAAISLFLLLSGLVPAWSNPLTVDGSGKVVEIVDGDTLILNDGREIRLVGIQAPKLPLGRRNFKTWPLADKAKSALLKLALYKTVTLSYGGRRIDRYNRLLAHLHDEKGLWIQGELLRRGMARVYSFSDNRAVVADMLKIEREARGERRGIWGHSFYKIRNLDGVGRDIGSFQLVEARIKAVAALKKYTYLNFGDDWRTDFTIAIPARARRLFKTAKMNLKSLEGQSVRVRGWVKSRNGPMIEASHPEQIEILR